MIIGSMPKMVNMFSCSISKTDIDENTKEAEMEEQVSSDDKEQ